MRGLAALLLALFWSGAAAAQCSFTNPTACGSPGMNNLAVGGTATIGGTLGVSGAATFSFPGPALTLPTGSNASIGGTLNIGGYVIHPTLYADGIHSDDANLQAAVTACAAVNGTIQLPSGQILLTGATSITLQGCGLVGAQVSATGQGATPIYGTTFVLTSTSVPPFLVGAGWSMSGVNFYWPTQTGSTVYPPLISQNGSNVMSDWFLDHVNLIDCYTCLKVTNGRFIISNSNIYAVHDGIESQGIGDQFKIDTVHFAGGPWNKITNGANAAALAIAEANATVFHITGPQNNFMIENSSAFGWRTGFLLDATATVGVAEVDMTMDFVGTFIDASSGGIWTSAVPVMLNGDCQVVGAAVQNFTCFNMGTAGDLNLHDSFIYSPGSFLVGSDTNQTLNNVTVPDIGFANDGSDYYGINITGTSGGQSIIVRNSYFSGLSGSVHSHGILLPSTPLARVAIQNNTFEFLNDDITGPAASQVMLIDGNTSAVTQGSASLVITGSNPINYGKNVFDKPPLSTVQNCGSGPTITGTLSGQITIGTPAPITSCGFTLPFLPGGTPNGNCVVSVQRNTTISWNVIGLVWTITFGTDVAGTKFDYSCPGQG